MNEDEQGEDSQDLQEQLDEDEEDEDDDGPVHSSRKRPATSRLTIHTEDTFPLADDPTSEGEEDDDNDDDSDLSLSKHLGPLEEDEEPRKPAGRKKPRRNDDEEEDDEPLPVPVNRWDIACIHRYIEDGKKKWKCLACGFVCTGAHNITKVKAHLAKITGEDVRTCTGDPSPRLFDLYKRMWKQVEDARIVKEQKYAAKHELAESRMESGVTVLAARGGSRNAQKYISLKQSAGSVVSNITTGTRAKNANHKSSVAIPGTELLQHVPGTGIQTYLSGKQPSAEANMNMDFEITAFILREGIPFSKVESPHLARLIKLAKAVTSDYKPPHRKLVAGKYLDGIYDNLYKENLDKLDSQADIFGIAIYGDGATVARTAFINILASGVHINNACLEIHDCTKRLQDGGTKDAEYIANLVSKHIDNIDVMKNKVDMVIFDGAANMQKAGKILEVRYPLVTCIHGAEHVVSLFFSDIAKHPVGQLYVKLYSVLFKWFGGRHQALHAMFLKMSARFNKGRKVSLMRPSGTRMAGYWIAWTRVLRLKSTFEALIVDPAYLDLPKKQRPPDQLVEILKMNDFWGFTYKFMRAMYGPLRLLRLADMKTACMDKLRYFVLRTQEVLIKEKTQFNVWDTMEENDNGFVVALKKFLTKRRIRDDSSDAEETVGSLECSVVDDDCDEQQHFAATEDASGSEDNGGNEVTQDPKKLSFGEFVMQRWGHRKEALEHDYAVAAWMLSPCPEIQQQVRERNISDDKEACNNLLKKLFVPRTLTDAESNALLAKIEDEFWGEWNEFMSRSGKIFGAELRKWLSDDISNNRSHIWHQKYSYHETKWLGRLACRVTSKINGIGNAERNWGKVKYLKSGQRAHLSSEMISKQATIYGSASAERAGRDSGDDDKCTKWEDSDLDSLGLSKFGVDEKSLAALLEVGEIRTVKCWLEDWEEECINANTKDVVKEERLLKKYGGLKFVDGEQLFSISKEKLPISKKGPQDKRYVVHAMKPSYNPDDVCDCDYENFQINTDLQGLIYEYYYHNPDRNIRVLTPPDTNDGNGKWLIWLDDDVDDEEGHPPPQRTSRSQVKKKKTRSRRSR